MDGGADDRPGGSTAGRAVTTGGQSDPGIEAPPAAAAESGRLDGEDDLLHPHHPLAPSRGRPRSRFSGGSDELVNENLGMYHRHGHPASPEGSDAFPDAEGVPAHSLSAGASVLRRRRDRPFPKEGKGGDGPSAASEWTIRLMSAALMSHGGLIARQSFAPSPTAFLLDAASCMLENILVMSSWDWALLAWGARSSSVGGRRRRRRRDERRKGGGKAEHVRLSLYSEPPSHQSRWMLRRLQRMLDVFLSKLDCGINDHSVAIVLFSIVLTIVWVLASWGDLVFQVESRGALPTRRAIAAGLADPTVHAAAQMKSHSKLFWGVLIRVLTGMGSGVAVLGLKVWQRLLGGDETTSRPEERGSAQNGNAGAATGGTIDADEEYKGHGSQGHNALKESDERIFGRSEVVARCFSLLLFFHFGCGSWAPATNLVSSFLGMFLMPPPGQGSLGSGTGPVRRVSMPLPPVGPAKESREKRGPRPNVLLVVHESLGAAPLMTARGKRAMPYWHKTLRTDPDFYSFRYARTVAGTTPIATPAILTGLLPYSEEGVAVVRGSSLAKDFKAAGYDTASFVSYGANWRNDGGGGWAILSDHLLDDFDRVVGPDEVHAERVNEFGMDDRKTIVHFGLWLRERRTNDVEGQGRRPFFGVVVFNNQHFPHLLHENYENEHKEGEYEFEPDAETRYFSSLRTADESLRAMFDRLRSDGELDNTIIFGAGDHGDTPGVMKRLGDVDSVILDVPLWMYVPKKLLPERAFVLGSGDGGTPNTHLRANIDRTVSTLDIVPTMRDLLGYPARLYAEQQLNTCVTGRSLLSSTLPKDRVAVGWGGAPLDAISVGSFMMTNVGFLYYPLLDGSHSDGSHPKNEQRQEEWYLQEKGSKSHVVRFKHDEHNPFFGLQERPFSSLPPKDRDRWRDMLRADGWLDHPMVKRTMPELEAFLGGGVGSAFYFWRWLRLW